MEPTATLTSLGNELEDWIDIIRRGDDFTCFGKSKGGERCHNKLGQDTLIKLASLFKKSAALLQGSHDGLEKLLEEASSLVMCIRYHQSQSQEKLEEWLGMISDTASVFHPDMSSNPIPETVKPLNRDTFRSRVNHTKLVDTGDTSELKEVSDLNCQQSLLGLDVNDSGIESSEEEDTFITQIVASKTRKSPPQTPQKASQPASTDSGISMSYDAHAESCMRAFGDREAPESPLTRKPKAKQVTARNHKATKTSTRPAVTPVQPKPLSIRLKNFASMEDPFIKMQKYISKPLGSGATDLNGGYIYGFQIDGCPFTKIGKSAVRKDKTPEDSLASRMKEHKGSRGPDLKIVLAMPVPFVGRIENLIKFHLAGGRMRETCSCMDSKGQPLNHGNHIEWFSNSLDEIWTVVIA